MKMKKGREEFSTRSHPPAILGLTGDDKGQKTFKVASRQIVPQNGKHKQGGIRHDDVRGFFRLSLR